MKRPQSSDKKLTVFQVVSSDQERRILYDPSMRLRESQRKLEPYPNLEKIDRTIYKCQCADCNGEKYLLTWNGRTSAKWENEGACLYVLALRMNRMALIKRTPLPDNIIDLLLEIAE